VIVDHSRSGRRTGSGSGLSSFPTPLACRLVKSSLQLIGIVRGCRWRLGCSRHDRATALPHRAHRRHLHRTGCDSCTLAEGADPAERENGTARHQCFGDGPLQQGCSCSQAGQSPAGPPDGVLGKLVEPCRADAAVLLSRPPTLVVHRPTRFELVGPRPPDSGDPAAELLDFSSRAVCRWQSLMGRAQQVAPAR